MSLDTCCLLGRGKLYVAPAYSPNSWGFNWGNNWGGAANRSSAGRPVGNVSNLSIAVRSSDYSTLKTSKAFLGPDCGGVRIDSIDIAMTLNCTHIDNLVDVLWGTKTSYAGLLGVDSEVVISAWGDGKFRKDDFIPYQHLGVDPESVEVSRADAVTITEGTHYEVTRSGIVILQEFVVGGAKNLFLSYEYNGNSSSVEAITKASKPVRFFFDGVNAADENDLFTVKIHKVRLKPVSALNLINTDDFMALELTGRLEPDVTIAESSGVSQYFSLERLE